MTEHDESLWEEGRAVAHARDSLRTVCQFLPHLQELAAAVRITADRRIATAGVFRSGRLLINPTFILGLNVGDAGFVMAHELLHLALRTHERGEGSDPRLVNYAHDLIINDMLEYELGRHTPAGGVTRSGARDLSLEELVIELQNDGARPRPAWRSGLAGGLGPAPVKVPGRGGEQGDVLDAEREREWFGTDDEEERRMSARVAEAVRSYNDLTKTLEQFDRAAGNRIGEPSEEAETGTAARTGHYAVPWEAGLQSWFQGVARGPRSFARPSRRGTLADGLVLPGRAQIGWTLNIVLDTSGSMVEALPPALGAIVHFADQNGVAEVRVLQCDTKVTRDEVIGIDELSSYQILGLGGSDMTPAMSRLAEDVDVQAVVVITDGCIEYPDEPPPYRVLWVVIDSDEETAFQPPYGQVIKLPPGSVVR